MPVYVVPVNGSEERPRRPNGDNQSVWQRHHRQSLGRGHDDVPAFWQQVYDFAERWARRGRGVVGGGIGAVPVKAKKALRILSRIL
jgi:hypothetical protein